VVEMVRPTPQKDAWEIAGPNHEDRPDW
jgi:hypothetical protein